MTAAPGLCQRCGRPIPRGDKKIYCTTTCRFARGLLERDEPSEDLIRRHVVYQERRANRPRSIEKRSVCIRALARFLKPRSLLDATGDDLEAFIDSRRGVDGGRLSTRSRAAYVSHFHAFYKWCLLEELLERDPTLRVVRPRVRRTLPRPMADHDLARALAEAPPQMRAILSLAAYGGLRCQELAGLDAEDVLEHKGLLRVCEGKGGHERMVPLHPEALAALHCMPVPKSGRLFTRPRGGGFTPPTMSLAIRDYFAEVGIGATPHQLRHWFGTSIYEATHDLRVTQELLGHQSPTTTQIYCAFSPVDARAAVLAVGVVGSESPH